MGKIWSRGAAACSVAPLCQIMSSLLKMTSLTSETDSKTASSSPSRHLSLTWPLAHTELLTSVLCLSSLHPLISAMSSNLECCHKWRRFSNHKKPQTCKYVKSSGLFWIHVAYQVAHICLYTHMYTYITSCFQVKISTFVYRLFNGFVFMFLHLSLSRVPQAPVLIGSPDGQRSLCRGLFLFQWHVSSPSAPPSLR